MPHELSPADLRRYDDDGFLIVEDLFSRDEVAALAAAAERLRAVGLTLAAALPPEGAADPPAESEEGRQEGERPDKAGERKIEHAGSQFVFAAANGAGGAPRLLRVV